MAAKEIKIIRRDLGFATQGARVLVVLSLVVGVAAATLVLKGFGSPENRQKKTLLQGITLPTTYRATVGVELDAVHTWNAAYVDAIRSDSTPPCLGARNLAILHVALDVALNQVQPRFAPLNLDGVPHPAPPDLPWSREQAAVAFHACAHAAGSALFPSSTAQFEALYQRQMAAFPRSPEAVSVGTAVADAVLRWRQNDGATTSVHYVPRHEPGAWRRTAPRFRPPETPQKANVRPFFLTSPSEFRPSPPPSLDSDDFLRALAEVDQLGGANSTGRSDEKSLIARFWSDFAYTCTPPGHWNEMARQKMEEREVTGHDAARLLALLNLAIADAAIAAWDCKYEYDFWRPETALSATGKEGWVSFLESPPHPEYVSGHGAISGAGATVMQHLLPMKLGESLLCQSDTVTGVVRTPTSYWDCAQEIAASRVFGGIHFRFSGEEGLALGRAVAEACLKRTLE